MSPRPGGNERVGSLLSIPDWIGVGTVLAGLVAAFFAARRVTTSASPSGTGAAPEVELTEDDRAELRRLREAADRLRHSIERLADCFPEHRRAIDDNTAELRRRRD